jgi:hypothetical protein
MVERKMIRLSREEGENRGESVYVWVQAKELGAATEAVPTD